MSQALANVQYKPTDIGTERLGQIMVKSGFFKDLREEAQAIVKILYGGELGFGPIASVMGVYIVEGKPSLSAQLIAAAVQKSGRFKYRVREWTATSCRIEFFDGGESLGESSFSIAEAQAANLAGKAVWKSYPKAMLWARAMSQGARAYAPEVFSGPIYTPEELGAEVDGDGSVIEVVNQEPAVEPTRARDVEDAPRPTRQRSREELLERYLKLLEDAIEMGMELDDDEWTVSDDVGVDVLRKKGPALATLIDKHRAQAAAPAEQTEPVAF